MRISVLTLIFFAILSSCSSNSKNSEGFGLYGDSTITEDGAIAAIEVVDRLRGNDSLNIKIKGDISGVCQAKGCWMNVPISAEEDMTIRFKGYKFFVPKNSKGHSAIIDGVAYVDTVSVARLRHKAEDSKKLSKEEIEKITEPEIQYSFMASGVIIL
jgi:Domain of unknown function (DUF4920)